MDRRPGIGIAWCHKHNMKLSECFDLHNPSNATAKKKAVNYGRRKEDILPERKKAPRGQRRAVYLNSLTGEDELVLELSFRDMREMDRLDPLFTFPKTTLRSWGFDPGREFEWFDDPVREVRVIRQKVEVNEVDATPTNGHREGWQWKNPLRRSR